MILKNKLCIVVCNHYIRELTSVIEAEKFDDVTAAGIPATCGYPSEDPKLTEEILKKFENYGHVELLRGRCQGSQVKSYDSYTSDNICKLDQCFYMVTHQKLIDEYQSEGVYLITPGWLVNWKQWIDKWGFDQQTAREFFEESTKKLVLLDTGIDPQSPKLLKELAEFISRPFEIFPAGLDYFRMFILNIIYERRLKNKKVELQSVSRDADQRISEYAMAMDLLDKLIKTKTEKEAIQNIIDIFSMLFAAEKMYYISLENEKKKDIQKLYSSTSFDDEAVINLVMGSGDEYIWNDTNDGFMLRFKVRNEMMGILGVEKLAFPEYKERYINLALTIAGVCGMAIENARTYQKFKDNEKRLLKTRKRLNETLIELKKNQQKEIEIENLKSVRELAGAAAHEYAQPLQALSNYLSLMETGGLPPESFRKARNSLQRIVELTENLRNLTRLQKKEYLDTQILDLKASGSIKKIDEGGRVLVVDDEEDILNTLVEMFQLQGFKCDGALDGFTALELLSTKEYRMIISDVMMPKMSGPEFFTRAREMGNTSYFMFITGYEISDELKKTLSKADAVLTKPVSFNQFFETIDQITPKKPA